MNNLFLYTDGGARNNPGPAATGFLIKDEEGQVVKKGGTFLGVATNNEAEYQALIEGLRAAKEFNPDRLDCFLDSLLAVNQLNGTFKIKEPRLRSLVFEVKTLEREFRLIKYCYIPREENKEADAIVNQILDEQTNHSSNAPLR